MPLLQTKTRVVLPMAHMHEAVLREIFSDDYTNLERDALDYSLSCWERKLNLTPDEAREIKRIRNARIANERGRFERAKVQLKKNNWHYRQIYRDGVPFIENPYTCKTYGRW